jgi:hypothetical protein
MTPINWLILCNLCKKCKGWFSVNRLLKKRHHTKTSRTQTFSTCPTTRKYINNLKTHIHNVILPVPDAVLSEQPPVPPVLQRPDWTSLSETATQTHTCPLIVPLLCYALLSEQEPLVYTELQTSLEAQSVLLGEEYPYSHLTEGPKQEHNA